MRVASFVLALALSFFATQTMAADQVYDVDVNTSTFNSGSIDVSFTAVLHPSGLWGDQTTHGNATITNVLYAADGTVTLDPAASTISLNGLDIAGPVNVSGSGNMNWAGLLDLTFVYTIVEQHLALQTPITVPYVGGQFQATTSYEFGGISDGMVTGLINYGIGQQNFTGTGDMTVDGVITQAGSDLNLNLTASESEIIMGGLPTVSVDVYDCALYLIGCIFYINTADITIDSFTYNNVTMNLNAVAAGVGGPVCGDNVVDAGETCDDGNTVGGDGCSATCQLEDCGDGVVQAGLGEECDDGNTNNEDGCSSMCLDEYCGDAVVQVGLGEGCDDGNAVDGDGCTMACQVEYCGDGVTQAGIGEQCDDANGVSGDGCSSICLLEFCGDNVVQAGLGENCDDGNTVGGDGCSATCLLEMCGNGIVDPGEDCDDANSVEGDGCSNLCVAEYCGDGVTHAGLGEQCDDGNAINEDGCSDACFVEICGDNVLQAGLGEACDDGNVVDEDGCSALCQIESCGDGIVQAGLGEQCDDGNVVPGDGCDDLCAVEAVAPVPLTDGFGVLALVLLVTTVGAGMLVRQRRYGV